jgi:hypothetical protein
MYASISDCVEYSREVKGRFEVGVGVGGRSVGGGSGGSGRGE